MKTRCLLVAVVAISTGCGNQEDPAIQAIKERNDRYMETAVSLEKSLDRVRYEVDGLRVDPNSGDYKKLCREGGEIASRIISAMREVDTSVYEFEQAREIRRAQADGIEKYRRVVESAKACVE